MPPKKERKPKPNNSIKEHEIKKQVVNLEKQPVALIRNPSENNESFQSNSGEIEIKEIKLEKGNSYQILNKSIIEPMRKAYPDIIFQRAIIFESLNKTVNHFSYIFDKQPEELDEPFSDFSKYIKNLKFVKKIHNFTQMAQRLFFQNIETKKQYVIFRDWKKFNVKEEVKGQVNPEYEKFKEEKYDKFVLMKYLSISPNFVNPIALNIIVAEKLELLISEMIVESIGDPLLEYPDKSPEFIFQCFIQLIDMLVFLKSSRINFCEIRPENLLIDRSSGNALIKLSDYDLIPLDSSGLEQLEIIQKSGLHSLFSSPEALKSVLFKPQYEEYHTSYWVSQLYSIGMTILFLMGFFTSQISLQEFLNIKLNEDKNKEFLAKIEEFIVKEKTAIGKNILRLVKIGLQYDPKERLNPDEFLNLIRGIKIQEDDEEIEKKSCIFKKNQFIPQPIIDNSQYAMKPEQDIQAEIDEISKKCENLMLLKRNKILENQPVIDMLNIDLIISSMIDRIIGPLNNEIITNFKEKTNEQIFGFLILDNIEMAQKITYYMKILISIFLKESNEHWKGILSKVGDYLPQEEIDKFKRLFFIIIRELEILINSLNQNNPITKIGLEIDSIGDIFIGQLELKTLFKFGIFIKKGQVYIGTFDNISFEGVGFILEERPENNWKYSYFGEFHKGQREGIGRRYFLNDNHQYIGQLKNDKRHGKGKYVFTENDYIEGTFNENNIENGKRVTEDGVLQGCFNELGQLHGQGKKQLHNGDEYIGEFDNGLFHGTGIYNFKEGNIKQISGPFIQGINQGISKITFLDGGIYEGYTNNLMQHGEGKMLFPNQSWYEGNWKDGKPDGQGNFFYSENEKYNGSFVLGETQGEGQTEYSDGRLYKGNFGPGRKLNGIGTYLNTRTNEEYIGSFLDNNFHGKGIYKDPNGNSFNATFVNGILHGYAEKCEWIKEEIIIRGNFENGKMNGKCHKALPYGQYLDGIFIDDQFIEGDGKIILDNYIYFSLPDSLKMQIVPKKDLPNECFATYDGKFKNGNMNGEGMLTYLNIESFFTYFRNDPDKENLEKFFRFNNFFKGKWIDGKIIDGKGTLIDRNQDLYNGSIQDSMKCFKDDFIEFEKSNFNFNKNVNEFFEEFNNKYRYKAFIRYRNGDYYIGEWKDDKFDGNGIYSFHQGNKLSGIWISGYTISLGENLNVLNWMNNFTLPAPSLASKAIAILS